jgi:hypothetical protein
MAECLFPPALAVIVQTGLLLLFGQRLHVTSLARLSVQSEGSAGSKALLGSCTRQPSGSAKHNWETLGKVMELQGLQGGSLLEGLREKSGASGSQSSL